MRDMPRTNLFARLSRTMRIARWCDEHNLPSRDGVERALALEAQALISRRRVLAGMGAAGALATLPLPVIAAKKSSLDVGIVGAGLAGLTCADRLRVRGTAASVYEASDRAGGRCFSLRMLFPGQVAERGGELIDNLHKTMLGYANAFGLAKEDHGKLAGEVFYYFNGQRYAEAEIVAEYRAFTAAMRADLQQMSREPNADAFNPADVLFDRMTIAEYLENRGAGPLLKAALGEAYVAEYGRELNEQNALNLLLFVKVDRRSRFMPFGVFSDERYHIVNGNDAIAQGIAAGLPRPVEYGLSLVRIRKRTDGRIELVFKKGATTVVRAHDAVVVTLPFSVLRSIDLDASLGLPDWKTKAIQELGYGRNAKQMVGFDGPFWRRLGAEGTSYSDLANCQTTWETNPSRATASHAVLTDYASGKRAEGMNTADPQAEAAKFVTGLEAVFPGAVALATKNGDTYLSHLEHWPSNPLSRGSYTCYQPGQFTTIAGNEGKPVGNLFFAGEHTNSFYDSQGFMEGAALSGIDAANAII